MTQANWHIQSPLTEIVPGQIKLGHTVSTWLRDPCPAAGSSPALSDSSPFRMLSSRLAASYSLT